MNNELVKEINGKEYHFKFSTKKCIDLEKITGKSIFELFQDMSMANIARLLKSSCVEPKDMDEYDLLDEVKAGSSLQNVMFDIIMETAVISGLITRADKDKMDKAIEKAMNEDEITEKQAEALDESKKK